MRCCFWGPGGDVHVGDDDAGRGGRDELRCRREVDDGDADRETADQLEEFIGKTVRIDGVVPAVCDKMGCWMDLPDEKADAKTGKTLA